MARRAVFVVSGIMPIGEQERQSSCRLKHGGKNQGKIYSFGLNLQIIYGVFQSNPIFTGI